MASRATISSGELLTVRRVKSGYYVVTLEVAVRAAGGHQLLRSVGHAEPGADQAAGRGVRQRGGRGPLHRRPHGDEDPGRGEARTHLLMHHRRPGGSCEIHIFSKIFPNV